MYRVVTLVDAYSHDQALYTYRCEGDAGHECVRVALGKVISELKLNPTQDYRLRFKVVRLSEPLKPEDSDKIKDGYYIIGNRTMWVLDGNEFNIDQAREYMAKSGFSRHETAQYMKTLRQSPIKVEIQ